MRLRLMTAFVLALLSATASAQTIHGSPQKAAYASPAEWPGMSSQCHWAAPNLLPPDLNDPSTFVGPLDAAHTHLDFVHFPFYSETLLGSFVVPFSVTLHHTAGRITNIWSNSISSFTLLDAKQWPIEGNPSGDVVVNGLATFDPSLMALLGLVPAHGWFPVHLNARTAYDNGDTLDNELWVSLYSKVDPLQPEAPPGDTFGTLSQESRCETVSVRDTIQVFGENIMEIRQMLPLFGPVSPEFPWRLKAVPYGYGKNTGLPPGEFIFRADPDLHHGVPGTILSNVVDTIVPGPLASGPHKLMFQWRQPSGAGSATFSANEELTSNLVFTINVGPGGVAQDDAPPPVVTPPPPPPPVPVEEWVPVAPLFQEFTIDGVPQGKFRFCIGTRCFPLP